ncbi:hypothetical protein [Streptomyces sp. DT171]|uniref:hypothetical protein n=1 Tax=Streptomyces sp. DT171 TaxID=3416524 RepID=UPI003CF6334A
MVTPLLLGAVACTAGGENEDGAKKSAAQEVYGQAPAKQLIAASTATRNSGTARFVSTLVYGSAAGEAVQRTVGSLDYAHHTAQADIATTVPAGFPAKAAELIGKAGTTGHQPVLVQKSDVLYQVSPGHWLRYEGTSDFAESAAAVLDHAGDSTPYAGTLADAVGRAIPTGQPKKEADGSRHYDVTMSGSSAEMLLPHAVRNADTLTSTQVDKRLPLSVVLNEEGRITRASADLGPLLDALHKKHILADVRTLRAEYTLTDHGKPVAYTIPSAQKAPKATTVLTDLHRTAAGDCGTTDTGLDSDSLIRRTDCGSPHTLRVLGSTKVDRTTTDPITSEDAFASGEDGCQAVFAKAPAAWRAEARPANTFLTSSAGLSIVTDGDPTSNPGTNHLTGDFVCYIRTG